LQPELLRSGDYTLSITVGPTLQFPIAGGSGKIGSMWGDERDAGDRRHEGIDLFAPKGTPVIAAADGVVTRVNENRLGGKVVWQRPKGKNLSLYYAHLDEQLVNFGQKVNAGDTIGLVGNTGNARTTPPHLHFGVYTFGGPIDPLPFVNPVIKKPAALTESIHNYREGLRIATDTKISEGGMNSILKGKTLVNGIAVNRNYLRIILPDATLVSVPFSKVERATAIKNPKVKTGGFLYDYPQASSARITKLQEGDVVSILGYFGDYVYIKTKAGINGWMPASLL
jgi:hypothetical protein